MFEPVIIFGIVYPFIWGLLAFSSGLVSALIIKSLLRWGDIVTAFSTTLFMAIPLLIIILTWRFLAFEQPITDTAANIMIFIGVIAGYIGDLIARVMVALEIEKRGY